MIRDHYFDLDPFRAEFQRGSPALLYHRLGRAGLFQKRRGLTLPPGVLARQIAELRASGFQSTTSPDDVGKPNHIFITFDDGDATALNALDPLHSHGFQAIQFLVASKIGGQNDWDKKGAPLMDESQVREWLAAGNVIGSHTLTHARLPSLSLEAAREEIASSKKLLEDRFGVPIEFFAYPWGETIPRLAAEVAAAGYRAAFTTQPGVNDPATAHMALRRHTVWCSLRHPRELWAAITA